MTDSLKKFIWSSYQFHSQNVTQLYPHAGYQGWGAKCPERPREKEALTSEQLNLLSCSGFLNFTLIMTVRAPKSTGVEPGWWPPAHCGDSEASTGRGPCQGSQAGVDAIRQPGWPRCGASASSPHIAARLCPQTRSPSQKGGIVSNGWRQALHHCPQREPRLLAWTLPDRSVRLQREAEGAPCGPLPREVCLLPGPWLQESVGAPGPGWPRPRAQGQEEGGETLSHTPAFSFAQIT